MPGLPPGPLTPHPRCLWGQPRRARPLQPPCDPRGTPRPRSWSPFPPTARCCPPPQARPCPPPARTWQRPELPRRAPAHRGPGPWPRCRPGRKRRSSRCSSGFVVPRSQLRPASSPRLPNARTTTPSSPRGIELIGASALRRCYNSCCYWLRSGSAGSQSGGAEPRLGSHRATEERRSGSQSAPVEGRGRSPQLVPIG